MGGMTPKERALAPVVALDGKKPPRPEGCIGCPFGGPKVGGRGNVAAPLVCIGESPGVQERRSGFPFVGPSGEVFFSAFPDGVDPDEVAYITNALQCLPKKKAGLKDQAKMVTATRCCHERLGDDILGKGRTKPEIILAMGNPALWSTTGNYGLKITQERGKLYPSKFANVGVVPAVHPAALMRGTGNYRQFVADVRYALHLSQGGDPRRFIKPKVYVVNNIGCAKALVKFLKTRDFIAGDIETEGFNRRHDKLLCVGLAYKPETVFVFTPETIKYLEPLFASTIPKFIWQNGKFDVAFLRREGIPARVDEDTMLLSYALDEQGGIHGLEQISSDLLGAPNYKHVLKPWLPNKGTSYAAVPSGVLYEYNGIDVSLTLQNFYILREQVAADPDLEKLYTKTLIPASELLLHVESAGLKIDQAHLAKIEHFYSLKVRASYRHMEWIIGEPFNPNSPKQVANILYDRMNFKSRHGRSTDKAALDRLPQTRFVKALKRYRRAAKAYSTYVKGFERLVDPETERVYATFNIHGTRTGRLSSSNPNLQNIPRESLLRGMFVPAPGCVFIETDLNQAELRSLACLSGDKNLIEIYTSTNRSIHNEMAERLYGKDFDHEGKMRAKMLNFGIVYGREAPSIAEQLRTPVSEGQRMIDGWFEAFPSAHEFIKECRRCVRRAATITTTFGRKKRHRIVAQKNFRSLQNEASNFPHQSIASDITLHAAIELRPLLESMGVRIVNLVHDSILVECPDEPEIVETTKMLMIDVMESIAPKWDGLDAVSFKAEGKIGYRWGEDYMEDFDSPTGLTKVA